MKSFQKFLGEAQTSKQSPIVSDYIHYLDRAMKGINARENCKRAAEAYRNMTAKGQREADVARTPEHTAYIKRAMDGDYWPD